MRGGAERRYATHLTAALVFLLAFAVRLAWVREVQDPLAAVYSDMGHYVARAERLLANTSWVMPRSLAFYPWGTHCLIAAELGLLGRKATVAIAIAHALLGAIPAACATGIAARLTPNRLAPAASGIAVALWHPMIVYAGFFSSELWFAALIAVAALLAARERQSAWSLFGFGVVSAAAFAVRPQFLLTWGLVVGIIGVDDLRKGGARGALRLLPCVMPLALVVAGSAVRLRALTGHYGLISENGAVMRVFAQTDVRKIESNRRCPEGEDCVFWNHPPSLPLRSDDDVVHIDGYIGDPDIMEALREERVRSLSWRRRVGLVVRNEVLLFARNLPWPESNYSEPFRQRLQRLFARGMNFVVVPLALAGGVLVRRSRPWLVVMANLVTVAVTAAAYLGEVRYRVPYDVFLLVLAVAGVMEIGRRVQGGSGLLSVASDRAR